MTVLERVFLLERLPSWHTNRLSRLVKRPKLHVGVEVKAAATVRESDLRGLRKLKDAAGKRFVVGVVLYDGSATIEFGDRLFAVPVRRLWERR